MNIIIKNALFLTLLLPTLFHNKSEAQVTKGKFLLSGLINPSIHNKKITNSYITFEEKTWNISSQLKAGYLLGDRLSLGIDFKSIFITNEVFKETSLMAGPLIRYYFLNHKLSLFGEGGLGLGIHSVQRKNFNVENYSSTEDLQYFNFGPGINYFLKENIALELTLIYQRQGSYFLNNSQYQYKTTSNIFDFKIGLLFLL